MNLSKYFFLPLGLIVLGLALVGFYFTRPVTLWVDGRAIDVTGASLTVGDAIARTGVMLGPEDWLWPAADRWIPASGVIVLERARPVSVWSDGLPLTFDSPERIPANLLKRMGLRLFPGDRLQANGRDVDPLQPLPSMPQVYLQFRPAQTLTVRSGAEMAQVDSSAETLGAALWAAGWALHPGDRVDQALDGLLVDGAQATLRRAQALNIQVGAQEIVAYSAAATVGEALKQAGVSLQEMDYSQPDEDQPLPADGRIRVVRVTEELVFHQITVPYKSNYAPAPNLELDQRSVLTPGMLGVKVSRERVRFEDGQEVSRQTEDEWVASEPVDQVLGYGTQVAVKSIDTPEGTLQYYRAVPMYATSYSPCQQGLDRCSRSTSSGLPLQKGVAAVTLSWYRMFKGARVYVPGYGIATIGDVGGGISGVYWIDLGYSDEDYVGWSQTVTVYFLTPAPANPPPILP
jgi:uncharacterized protein YabE (DUF348 family)